MVKFDVGLTKFMTPKRNRVIRGHRDLLNDPKGNSDLCGMFDLLNDPKMLKGH